MRRLAFVGLVALFCLSGLRFDVHRAQRPYRVLWTMQPVRAAWDKGFNFRATSGYVMDGANETYVLAETTSQNRNSVTFQWGVTGGGMNAIDRNAGIDRRLAGGNYVFGATGTFSVTLTAIGAYDIGIALGDAGGAQSSNQIVVKDNVTTIFTLSHNTGMGEWYDATDVSRNSTTWPATGATAYTRYTFGSTNFNMVLTGAAGIVSHLFLSQVGAVVTGCSGQSFGALGVGKC